MRETMMKQVVMKQAYQNTPHDDVMLFHIAHEMTAAGLSEIFIAAAIRTALEYEGVADLIKMWAKEKDTSERNEIIADIQEMIDACSQTTKLEYPTIKFNDLNNIDRS